MFKQMKILQLLEKKSRSTINNWLLARRREKLKAKKGGDLVYFNEYQVRITDGPNFYIQYKDIFLRRIYQFQSLNATPVVIDGGSNIGMSILFFKKLYPAARITAFEPDPVIYSIAQENLSLNHIHNVTLIQSGLSNQDKNVSFIPDGRAGGALGNGRKGIPINVTRLSRHIEHPVDFLKLNIEGEELFVLQELAEANKLSIIREMVVEYHGWPSAPQRLGAILDLLGENGFRYLVHDFDNETCRASKPPFTLTSETRWYCLVYAKRFEG